MVAFATKIPRISSPDITDGDDDANAQINYSVMQVYLAQLSDYLVEQMPDLTMM